MGNYVFDADALIDAVLRDGERTDSNHDMGGDIVPDFVARGAAGVYDLNRNDVPGSTDRDRYYWRDVGTIDSFFEAHQDLISALPSSTSTTASGRSSASSSTRRRRSSCATRAARSARRSTRSSRSARVISGAHVERSVLGPWATVELGRAGRRLDPVRARAHRGRRRRAAALSSTRTSSSRPARASASTTTTTARAASPSPTPASPSSARASRVVTSTA